MGADCVHLTVPVVDTPPVCWNLYKYHVSLRAPTFVRHIGVFGIPDCFVYEPYYRSL